MEDLTITDPVKMFEVTNTVYRGDLEKMYSNFVQSIIASSTQEEVVIQFKSDDDEISIPFKLERHNLELFISELKSNLIMLEYYELLELLKQSGI